MRVVEVLWEMLLEELEKLRSIGVGGALKRIGEHTLERLFKFKRRMADVDPCCYSIRDYCSVGDSLIGLEE
jgi:hypothetical protein